MKKLLLIIFLLGSGIKSGNAQFQTGVCSSTRAGVMGVTINPANTNYLSNGTDVLLFNYGTTLMNNGYYLTPRPVTSIVSPTVINKLTAKSTNGESINETFDKLFSLKRSFKTNNYIFADATIYGPSFLMNLGKHSFGILTSLKAVSGTTNMPKELAIFVLKGSTASELQGKTFNLNSFVSGTMVYTDIAFNYSYQIVNNYKSRQRLGITAHYLSGINSLDFEDRGGTKWSFIGDSSIYMDKGHLYYNYAAAKSTKMSELLATRGRGFAFDIGYNYISKKKSRPTRTTMCPNIRFGGTIREYQEYKWRFGASLMDIGMITYDKQTDYNEYVNASGTTKNLDKAFYLGVFALDRKLWYDFSSNNSDVKYISNNKYTHYTATRLNVQFDYHYKDNYYFSFNGSHRLPMPGVIANHAPNILSLAARYESTKYQFELPISLIEYQYPIIGFNFRVGPFYMGTNHLPEIIGLRNIRGLDIFAGLKLNISNLRGT